MYTVDAKTSLGTTDVDKDLGAGDVDKSDGMDECRRQLYGHYLLNVI